MIYIIHKILVLFKNHLNDLKDNILEWFFKKYIYSFLFFKTYNNEKSKAGTRKYT